MWHSLELGGATLHGHFSRDFPPVLTIDPGDTVTFRTLDAGGRPAHTRAGATGIRPGSRSIGPTAGTRWSARS